MKPATECLQNGKQVSASDAIRNRQRRGTCLECGRPVRATDGDPGAEPWFRHYRRNPKCSISNAEPPVTRVRSRRKRA
jgi:adenine-specific DNA methylase